MKIAMAADHAGFALKEKLRVRLAGEGHHGVDFGADSAEACDHPHFAQPVAHNVAQGHCDRGIPACFTGIGMAMAANKVTGIRAAAARSAEEARLIREHNDANVLTLGAKYLDQPGGMEPVELFLHTEFAAGRHARRIAKSVQLEYQQA
jgi:ribose 5-phosphate isomerase B